MEKVNVPNSPGFSLSLARVPGARLGVIVVQEIYGVNKEVLRVVHQLSGWGFNAAAPDLLWRHKPDTVFGYDERDQARAALSQLNASDFVADTVAAARTLKDETGSQAIAILTLGWGGKFGLQAATQIDTSAVVCFYPGNLDGVENLVAEISAPQLYHFADRDPRTPPALRAAVRQHAVERDDIEVIVHKADHGFANRDREEFDQTAAASADRSTEDFLRRVVTF